jgi:hypothetical protein
LWIDEIRTGSAAGEEGNSEYGWEDDYWIEAFLLRENGAGKLITGDTIASGLLRCL